MQDENRRSGAKVSLHPLTTAQALSAALRVKPADLKAMEAKERAERKAKSKKKWA